MLSRESREAVEAALDAGDLWGALMAIDDPEILEEAKRAIALRLLVDHPALSEEVRAYARASLSRPPEASPAHRGTEQRRAAQGGAA